MESLIDIDILEVKSPSQFKARVALPWEQKAFEEACRCLQDDMEIIQRNTIINHDIHTHEVCAVKDSQEDVWHRVQVEKVLYTSKGYQASCYFVDSGKRQQFVLHRLYKLPEKYQKHNLPFQVRMLKLGGLQPMTLRLEITDTGIDVPHRPVKKWDSSAETYFSQLTEDCERAGVLLEGREDKNGRLPVTLFLHSNGHTINVNNLLIHEKYACVLSTDDRGSGASRKQDTVQKPGEQKRLSPESCISSSSERHLEFRHRRCDTPDSVYSVDIQPDTVGHSYSDLSADELLTTEGLKHVMAKVQRMSSNKKYDSDTEVLNTSRAMLKSKSRPALGSRPVSRNTNIDCHGDSLNRQMSSQGVMGAMTSPLSSVAIPKTCSRSGYESQPDVTRHSHFKHIPAHCASDSDSSSYSELHSFHGRKQSEGINSKLLNSSSDHSKPAVTNFLAKGDHSMLAHSLVTPVSGRAKQPEAEYNRVMDSSQSGVMDSSKLSPVSHAASSHTAGLSASQPPSLLKSPASGVGAGNGAPAAGGRGRGLMKLLSEHVTHKLHELSPPQTKTADAQNASKATDSLKTNAFCKAAYSNVTASDPHKSAFQAWNQKTEDSASSLPVDLLPSDRSEILDEFYKKRRGVESCFSENNITSDMNSGRLIDVGRKHQIQSGRRSDLSHQAREMVSPTSLAPCNLREIDLSLETVDGSDDRGSRQNAVQQRGSKTARLQSLVELMGSDLDERDPNANVVKVPLVWRPDRPMPAPFLGTMAWGIQLPDPVYDVDEIQLNSVVKQYMIKENFKTPRAIQANTWPALLRGRNIIGITPPHSGKTTSYLPTLVSELLKFPKYQTLPKGMGPKAVILVGSCKKADDILHYVHSMIQNKTTFRVLSIYGSEDHQVMPLLRGCDLLVATPHCLLRMLDSRYTHLDRLCHLVLDGAQILVDEFTAQVRDIMTLYAEMLKKYKALPVTRQVMVFGTQWSPALAAFQKAYQPDPILVFASRLEASVYGRVKQEVHMCFETKHLATLKDVLEKLMQNDGRSRIVIATAKPENIITIDQLLRSMSVYAQVVGHEADVTMIEESVGQWLDQSGTAVLVVTDNNVIDLRLTSADTVIHFDIPKSKGMFGNRLALMLKYFQDHCNEQYSEDTIRAESHLLLTNTMVDHVQSLHSFLVRSGAAIPSAMTRLLDGMYEGKNQEATLPLCPHLKQFGRCRYEAKCECRHMVLPCDLVQDTGPQSWPPPYGKVRVRILRVIDASHYYALLLEHQAPGGERRDLQCQHTSLIMDIAMFFSCEQNHNPYLLQHGSESLAAVKDSDGLFHRARVLSELKANVRTSKKVEVLYVDEGRKVVVQPEQLLKLPPKLQDIPPLAVEVYICRVKPVDGDTEWTRSSVAHVKNQLKDKDLFGNIILRMKNTLWLDPLAEQTKLVNVKTSIISMIVRPDLLKRGYAHDNPDHVKNLYKLCEGKVPIDKQLYRKYFNLKPRQELNTETFRDDQEYHDVCITAVESPHHFFVQKICYLKQLEQMQQALCKHMDKTLKGFVDSSVGQASGQPTPNVTPSKSPQEVKTEAVVTKSQSRSSQGAAAEAESGSGLCATLPESQDSETKGEDSQYEQGCLCVTKFHEDGSWNRVQLVEKVGEDWRVFFVDYGDKCVIAQSNLHPIPAQFCKLSAQAIECALGYVSPAGGEEWPESSGDLIWDLSHTVNREKKHQSAKVLTTQKADFAGATKYVIELYNKDSNHQLRFSWELVWAHEATTEDDEFENLFPKVTFNSRKLYRDLDTKISDLCAALYWTQAKDKGKPLSKQISDVLGGLKLGDGLTVGHSGLRKVVQLIGYLRSSEVQSDIISALIRCVESNPEVSATVFGQQLVLQLAFCIEQVCRSDVHLQAVSATTQLAKIEKFTSCLDQQRIISVMVDTLISEDPSPEVLRHVCTFLTYMLMHGKQCVREMEEQDDAGPMVFGIMAEISDPDLTEVLLSLVAAMATCQKLQASIMREKHIQQILNIMREAPSQRCVFHCARICLSLCQAHRRNKRILLEAELVLIIRDLLDGGLQSPARDLCKELNASLAVSGPQKEVLAGLPIHSSGDAHATQTVVQAPPVKWSQNSFRVLLTVTIQGAKESDFNITSNQLHFRCSCEGRVYGFDYTLFSGVVVDKCLVTVHHTEVLLSLAKQIKGMWSRLLKNKQKCANVKLNFDNLVDSSDSEVEEPENVTLLSRKKSKLPKYDQTEPVDYHLSFESSTDSLEGMGSDSDDERFEDPRAMADPMAALDELMYRNASAQ